MLVDVHRIPFFVGLEQASSIRACESHQHASRGARSLTVVTFHMASSLHLQVARTITSPLRMCARNARSIHTTLKVIFSDRYEQVIVDEFQDISEIQIPSRPDYLLRANNLTDYNLAVNPNNTSFIVDCIFSPWNVITPKNNTTKES